MKKFLIPFLLMVAVNAPLVAQEDSEGCKNPALFTRMPNFHIYRCEDVQFDKFEFPVSQGKVQPVEGHRLYVNYYLNENAQTPGGLQITRNYTNAVKKIGGQVIYEYEDGGAQISIMKLTKNGLEVWAMVNAARLKAFGDGPTAPVASNDKEEGRALNRRVELVKQ